MAKPGEAQRWRPGRKPRGRARARAPAEGGGGSGAGNAERCSPRSNRGAQREQEPPAEAGGGRSETGDAEQRCPRARPRGTTGNTRIRRERRVTRPRGGTEIWSPRPRPGGRDGSGEAPAKAAGTWREGEPPRKLEETERAGALAWREGTHAADAQRAARPRGGTKFRSPSGGRGARRELEPLAEAGGEARQLRAPAKADGSRARRGSGAVRRRKAGAGAEGGQGQLSGEGGRRDFPAPPIEPVWMRRAKLPAKRPDLFPILLVK